MKHALFVLVLLVIPLALAVDVLPGNLVTNNVQPTIHIFFDKNTSVTNASLWNVSGRMPDTFFSYDHAVNDTTHWYFSIEQPLAHGNYSLRFNATDALNNSDPNKRVYFFIDLIKPNITALTMYPWRNDYLNVSNQTITVTTMDNLPGVRLIDVVLRRQSTTTNITAQFRQITSWVFQGNASIPDGNYTLLVNISDAGGNRADRNLSFLMNAEPFRVFYVAPPFGYTAINPFNLTLGTNKQATCYYSKNRNTPFGSMLPFTESDGFNHLIASFLLDAAIQNITVQCMIQEGGLSDRFSIELGYDATLPNIQDMSVHPNNGQPVINEDLDNAYLRVLTDDTARCKYSFSTDNYTDMLPFENFSQGIFDVSNAHFFNGEIENGNNYTVFVRCENRAGLISSARTLPFSVDLQAAATITIISPLAYVHNPNIVFNITTTEATTCTYDGRPFEHGGGTRNLYTDPTWYEDGSHSVVIACEFQQGLQTKNVTFIVDTVQPSQAVIAVDNISCNPERITASFSANDTNGILGYNYTVSGPGGVVKEWTFGSSGEYSGDLQEGATYTWRAYAIDRAGNAGPEAAPKSTRVLSPDSLSCDDTSPQISFDADTDQNQIRIMVDCYDSDSGCVDTFWYDLKLSSSTACTYTRLRNISQPVLLNDSAKFCALVKDKAGNNATKSEFFSLHINATHCNNSEKDGDESDTDCGGSCLPCTKGKHCTDTQDCLATLFCAANSICQQPTCNDTIKNGQESDVDCSGDCPPCALNKTCTVAVDCESGYCASGKCSVASCNDGVQNGNESDIDCGGQCVKCELNNRCVVDADCMSGLCKLSFCTKKIDEQEVLPPEEASHTASIVLLIIGGLLMLGGAGYLVYVTKFASPPATPPAMQQKPPQRPVLQQSKGRFHFKKRPSLLPTHFAPAPEKKPVQEEYVDVRDLQTKSEEKSDAFKELEKVSSDVKDPFAALSKIGDKAIANLATKRQLDTQDIVTLVEHAGQGQQQLTETVLKKLLSTNAITKKEISDALFELMDQQKIRSDDAQKFMSDLDI
ncbi:MAG: hypothetical protein V1725_06200 [archaeon]